MTKPLTALLLIMVFVNACAQTPTSTPALNSPITSPTEISNPTPEKPVMSYAPQPNDVNLSRGNIFIEEMGLLIRESFPPQITLGISGNLPTPCHELRAEISQPDPENKINLDVYTVVDPKMLCTQVLKPFHENIDLGTFPTGHYSVWSNGELAGEFDS